MCPLGSLPFCLLGCSDEDDAVQGSGAPEWCQAGTGELLLNELVGKDNAIELWNRGGAPIDVSGYTLATIVGTKGGNTTVPAGSIVPPGGPLAIRDLDTGLRLFAASTLTLSDAAGGVIDCTSFSTVDVWTSWCRIPDGTGPWARCSTTLGLLNQPESTGSDGTDGTEAGDGTDGTDGTDGLDGSDGTDGSDGVDGLDGVVPNAEIVLNELDGPNKTIVLEDIGRPTGLAIEPDGTMYVVDQSIGVLFHLDAEGKLLRRLDPELVSANYLYDPMDIVVDRDRDQLFVVSADGGKVYVFGLTSGLLRKDVYVGYKPEGTPDADGSFELRCGGAAAFLGPRILFLVDWDYGRVMLHDLVVGDDLFNPAKKYGFFASIGRPGDGCGELDGPWAIAACEAADLIAVSDPYNFRVQLFKVSKLLELIEKFE